MSDQQEPIEAQEATPDIGTPEPTEPTTQQIVDFEKRYNDIRPEFDRTQNELHRYQNDPEFRQQLFNELAAENGYTLDDAGEPEYDEYADPSEALQKELQQLKEWRDGFVEQTQMQQQAAIAEHYSENKMTEFGIPAEGEDAELQRNWIVTRAMALPAHQDEHGNIVPDIEAAYAEFRRIVPAAQPAQPEVPFTPQGGQENTGVPAWSDNPLKRREQREQVMLQALERQRGN